MGFKYAKLVIFMVILTFLSGCLVFDNTEHKLSREERQEAEERAKDITASFFANNEYPGFDPDELMSLMDEDAEGEILTIDPIFGPRYGKDYEALSDELENHILTDSEDAEYYLKYGEEGEGSYSLEFEFGDFSFREITHATLPFRVDFKVYETIEGNRLLTDNGTAFFELTRHSRRWWIEDVTINFRELGAVSIDEKYDSDDD